MRARVMAFSVLLTIWAGPSQAEPWILSLGDSLAASIQPNAAGVYVETNQGYAEYLYAFYRPRIEGLRLKKLGCSGETTLSMITGGLCTYDPSDPSFSQLDAAIDFLATHDVALITIDIGADNLLGCFDPRGTINSPCVQAALTSVGPELHVILNALRTAASHVPIVGMNYYDPFLAAWVFGPEGRALAIASLPVTLAFNAILQNVYQFYSVPVADVARAFRITNWNPVPLLGVPVNVLLALAWTWMGALPPVGPDVHPNAAGYAVIALAFVKAIESQ